MVDEGESHVEPPPLDHDAECLHCSYNLRGLSGDPVRCPECGRLNSRADLACPPKMVERRIAKLESAGAMCFVVVPAAVALTGAMLWQRAIPVLGVVLILGLPAWVLGAARFRSHSLGEPGWLRVLLWNHVYWGELMGFAIGAWLISGSLMWGIEYLARGDAEVGLRHAGLGLCLAGIGLWATGMFGRVNRPREAAIDRLARAAERRARESR